MEHQADLSDIKSLRTSLQNQGYGLIQYDNGPVYSYPYDTPWLDDPDFNAIYAKIRTHTLVDRNRCYALYLLMQSIKQVSGDILELGVWRGGTSALFALVRPEKTIYAADTFEGVVKSSDWESYNDGAHNDTSKALVLELFKKLKIRNYEILHGIFPEDTGSNIADRTFAFIHLDADVYQSTKDAFSFLWPKVSVGGMVAFDDYGFIATCEGVKRYVDEIKLDKDKLFIQNLNGHAYIIKRY